MTCSKSELLYLNKLIVARVKLLNRVASQQTMTKFYPGQKVSFADYRGNPVEALILKLNVKTVSVVDEYGELWKVAPALLRPL